MQRCELDSGADRAEAEASNRWHDCFVRVERSVIFAALQLESIRLGRMSHEIAAFPSNPRGGGAGNDHPGLAREDERADAEDDVRQGTNERQPVTRGFDAYPKYLRFRRTRHWLSRKRRFFLSRTTEGALLRTPSRLPPQISVQGPVSDKIDRLPICFAHRVHSSVEVLLRFVRPSCAR